MVSIGPYNESTNFRHMFNIPDLRGPLPVTTLKSNSLANLIAEHPDFSKYRFILELSKLTGLYNDPQANFTVFVPSDRALKQLIPESVFTNMDSATARHIIRTSTLNRNISSAILEDSPAAYFLTKDPPNRLFITNVHGRTYIDNTINVIHKDMRADNGTIHVIDNLIVPIII